MTPYLAIFAILKKSRPFGLTREQIWDHLYAHRADGGPEYDIIKTYMHELRHRMPASLRIARQNGSKRYHLLKQNETLSVRRPADVLTPRQMTVYSKIETSPGTLGGAKLASVLEITKPQVYLLVKLINQRLAGLNRRIVSSGWETYAVETIKPSPGFSNPQKPLMLPVTRPTGHENAKKLHRVEN